MNVDFPTPVSPITRKCFDSSFRRIRRNLSRAKSKTLLLPWDCSVELPHGHALWAAELLTFARFPPPPEIKRSAHDKKHGRQAGPNDERDRDEIAWRLAVINGRSQPLCKHRRLHIDETARKAGHCRWQCPRCRIVTIDCNDVEPVKQRSPTEKCPARRYTRLQVGAEIERLQRRLEGPPGFVTQWGSSQRHACANQKTDRNASRELHRLTPGNSGCGDPPL